MTNDRTKQPTMGGSIEPPFLLPEEDQTGQTDRQRTVTTKSLWTPHVRAPWRPWASSRMAYLLSRSLGVGARIIRRRNALASICHC